MNTISYNKGRVLTVAHQGLAGLERGNTAAAFLAAANRSYFGIETDVHPTVDGKFVLIHNDTTGSVAGEDLPVEDSTQEALQALVLNDRDGVKRQHLRIPTLQDYISICRRYKKIAVLELKNHFEPEAIRAMLDIIREEQYLHGMIFISFDLANCIALRAFLPEQPIQYLVSEITDQVLADLARYHLDIDAYYKALTAENVAALKAAGITVNCWTVDDPTEAEQLVSWGVDQITSNILE